MKLIKWLLILCSPCLSLAQDNPLYLEPTREDADRLLSTLRQTTNDTLRMSVYRDLSLYYLDINTDSSLFFIEKALPLAQKLKLKLSEADIWDLIALNLRNQGNYTSSLKAFNEALSIAKNQDSENGIWQISKFTGTNDPEFARLSMLATIESDMVELYAATGNYEKELEMARACYANATRIQDQTLLSQVYRHFGQIFTRNESLDSALVTYEKYFEAASKAGFRKYSHLCYNNIGNIYLRKNQPRQALNSYHSALQASRDYNNYWGIGSSHIALAKFYNDVPTIDSALYHAKAGLAAFKRSGQVRYYNDAYNTLVSVYKKMNKPDSALFFMEAAAILRDSLTDLEKINQFHSIDFAEQLKIQELEKEKIETRNKIRSYSLAAGLGVICVIAFILYRNNVQKQKANTVLENTLTHLKDTQAQLIQSEKMASLGELTAGIAHEIQNPLNFVNNFSEVNKELVDELCTELNNGNVSEASSIAATIKENEAKIGFHGKRAEGIVKSMLQHTHASSGTKEPVNLNALAEEYLRLAFHGFRVKDKDFQSDFTTKLDPSVGKVSIVQQDIARVLLNLINNAFYAVNEKRKLGIDGYQPLVKVSTQRQGSVVRIEVKDNGQGISSAHIKKIFQPFFTTKPTGEGTGLGLSLAYDIINAHGGKLEVESKEGEGTMFTVQLPV